MPYLFFAFIAFFLTVAGTFGVRWLAKKWQIVDAPTERKVHCRPVPLLGGLAIFVSFFIVLGLAKFFTPYLNGNLANRQLMALFLGSVILMVGGFLDDKYNLKPRWQIIFPILAAMAVLWGGVNLKEITNPWGGTVALNFWHWGAFVPLTQLLVFGWLMGMMYTTKLLDGLDGLAAGLTAIGSMMIFFLANSQKFYQPDIALIALIFAAANLGFLIFNFYPAKIFLGEGGSLMSGFILGFLAIAAGGKIATTLLVMGIAALDILMVIARRVYRGQPFWQADSWHLHYRLLALGFSQRQVVLFFYCLAAGFGILTLFLQSRGKVLALFLLVIIGVLISASAEKGIGIFKK
ncbi:MAG: undecaprenyl/decaprenyl-phosphate alpha-N-acetylglucosaminyl 1-phosphate transferase [Candidatus Magasanikbacteria bacterium]|nr:undecaprenyl/decaprenyl-phosphate alpha-N-acetylglucosaminyl 1-phosphate transferase [Candidatus Magasanikbacteria bacterium]